MSSRLASLLVRDGLVRPEAITAAMGRQVIYGGTLDTALLEMSALDELTLWQYLSETAMLPVPPPELVEAPQPGAAARFDVVRADRCHAVPVAQEGMTLRLLCTEPVQGRALQEAAFDLGLDLDLYVVPEVRLMAAREVMYQQPAAPRFLALLSRLIGAAEVRRWAAAHAPPPSPTPPRPAAPAESPLAASPAAPAAPPLAAPASPSLPPPAALSVAAAPLATAVRPSVPAPAAPPLAAAPLAAAPLAAAPFAVAPFAAAVSPSPPPPAAPHLAAAASPSLPPPAAPPLAAGPAPGLAVGAAAPAVPATAPAGAADDARDANDATAPVARAGAVARAAGDTLPPGSAPGSTALPDEDQAFALLRAAGTRDQVLEALVEVAARRLAFVALLTVSGQGAGRAAQGRLARAGNRVDRDKITRLVLALDDHSPFARAVDSGQPVVGPLGESDTGRAYLAGIRRRHIPWLVVTPLVLKGRTVCLLAADRGGDEGDGGDGDGGGGDGGETGDADYLGQATAAAAAALERIILRQKTDAFARPAADDAPARRPILSPVEPDIAADGAFVRPATGAPAPGARVRAASSHDLPLGPAAGAPVPGLADTAPGSASIDGPAAPGPAAGPHPTARAGAPAAALGLSAAEPAGPSRAADMVDVDALLDAYESDPEGPIGDAAASAVVRRGDVSVVLGRLTQRLFDGRSPPEGALMRLVTRFGDAALPLLRPLLDHAEAAWRRRGAEMLGAISIAGAEESLCRLAEDPDASVRGAALRALRRRPNHPQARALAALLRERLTTGAPARATLAAQQLGEMRDRDAVPALVDRLKAPDTALAAAARHALVAITKQDFSDSRWRWGSWWKRAHDQDRIEWLLEGLAHKEAEIRLSASEELRALTGEYFGYHFDLPKREREEARRRWIAWWEGQGKTRRRP